MSDYISIASAVFTGVSAFSAAYAIIAQSRTMESERYLSQCIQTLERAFNALAGDQSNDKAIQADRLNWLTSARHIERFKEIKKKIKRKEHVLICNEQEEHWRHQFYLLLNNPQIILPGFYEENIASGKSAIEPRSAIIIHDFAKWPDKRPDPIEFADVETILKYRKVLEGNIGLRIYLGSKEKYRKIIEAIKT